MFLAALTAGVTFGWPTQAEFDRANPAINQALDGEIQAYRRGKGAAAAVADRAMAILDDRSYPEYSSTTDPVYVADTSKGGPMMACGRFGCITTATGHNDRLAYLCIGPDLLAEQTKAK